MPYQTEIFFSQSQGILVNLQNVHMHGLQSLSLGNRLTKEHKMSNSMESTDPTLQ